MLLLVILSVIIGIYLPKYERFTSIVNSLTSDGSSTLLPGDYLLSSDNMYKLLYQKDGNLVIYPNYGGTAIWSSNTPGHLPGKAVMQEDGNFVLYDKNNYPYWATETYGKGAAPYRMTMQKDRNLVLYSNYNNRIAALWTSNTNIPNTPNCNITNC